MIISQKEETKFNFQIYNNTKKKKTQKENQREIEYIRRNEPNEHIRWMKSMIKRTDIKRRTKKKKKFLSIMRIQ